MNSHPDDRRHDWASFKSMDRPESSPTRALRTASVSSGSDLLPLVWLALICLMLLVLLYAGALRAGPP